jgi:hypothetical protein
MMMMMIILRYVAGVAGNFNEPVVIFLLDEYVLIL